jgi:hypothetical protein
MPWRKSSYSMGHGNCAEVNMEWRKSTYSTGNGQYVQVAQAVAMRDSKDPDGAVLTFTPGEWTAFISGVNAGEFDLAG